MAKQKKNITDKDLITDMKLSTYKSNGLIHWSIASVIM